MFRLAGHYESISMARQTGETMKLPRNEALERLDHTKEKRNSNTNTNALIKLVAKGEVVEFLESKLQPMKTTVMIPTSCPVSVNSSSEPAPIYSKERKAVIEDGAVKEASKGSSWDTEESSGCSVIEEERFLPLSLLSSSSTLGLIILLQQSK
ncbi:hypothetical protein GQ457_03G018460 [Hibiscus cannabinus]